MSFAQGSRSGLSYVIESTFGTTPATPQYVELPYNTHTLELTKDRVQGNELQPDRMLRIDRHGNRKVAGDMVTDLRKNDFDPFLEAVFMNTFGTSATLATTGASSSSGTATITFATQASAPYAIGSTIIVAGVTPTGFNGTFVVTACTTTSVSFLNSTTGPQTVAGTVGLANTLKIGTLQRSFSIEDSANDIGQYRLFTGVAVNTLAVSIKPNQMVTGTFGMIGKDMSLSATSLDPIKTATSINQPFDSYSGNISIGDAGGTLSAVATITGIDFTINNALAPTFVVGSSTTPQIEYGMATVEGTITAYFQDATLLNRFINETQTGFQVSINDPSAASAYTWLFPRVKINGAAVPVSGPLARVITMPFVALYDTTENTSVKLTRSF